MADNDLLGTRYDRALRDAIQENINDGGPGSKCGSDPNPEKWWGPFDPDTPREFFEELCDGCPLAINYACLVAGRKNSSAVGPYGGVGMRLNQDEAWLDIEGTYNKEEVTT